MLLTALSIRSLIVHLASIIHYPFLELVFEEVKYRNITAT